LGTDDYYHGPNLYTAANPDTYTWSKAKKGFLLTKSGMCGLSYEVLDIVNWSGKVFIVREDYVGVIDTMFVEPEDLTTMTLGEIGDLLGGENTFSAAGGVVTPDSAANTDVLEWDMFFDDTIGRVAQPFVQREDYAFHIMTGPLDMGLTGELKHWYTVEVQHTCPETLYVVFWTRETPKEDWFCAAVVPLNQPDTVAEFSAAGRECRVGLYAKNFTQATIGNIVLGYKRPDSRHVHGYRRPIWEAV